MPSANATQSQVLKTGGVKLQMSSTPTTDLAYSGPFVDLAPIIKDFDYQGGQATEEETTTLASKAKEFILGLSDAGSDIKTLSGRKRINLRADVMEALIAALYLDGGFEVARDFVLKYWQTRSRLAGAARRDP